MSTKSSNQHLAAVATKQATPLEVTERNTPKPGPGELLINVKSIALNPIDWKMRDFPMVVASWPAVVGSDISGIVEEVGPSQPQSNNNSVVPQKGDRVLAFAQAFYKRGDSDYGAFQTKVIVPVETATVLPESVSFNQAASLPLAFGTAAAGFHTIGIDYLKAVTHDNGTKQGLLVWGAAGSLGTAVVQMARLMGFTVYATASTKNHDLVKGLGVTRVFDYKESGVEKKIVEAAKEDGVTLNIAYDAGGQLQSILDVVKEFGPGAKVASAVRLDDSAPSAEGVEVKFVVAPADEKERLQWSSGLFHGWLKQKLASGEVTPVTPLQIVPGGLKGINGGLEELKKGVSAVKLVVEV